MRFHWVAFCFFLLFFTKNAFSQVNWTHFGVRPLGMGNAFVAVADDFNALYYNPAGLARIKEWQLELINPTFDISLNSAFLIRGALKNFGDMSLEKALKLLKDQAGLPHHVGFQLSPYFVAPGWGIGLASENFLSFKAHQDIDIDTQAIAFITAPLAFAKSFFDGRLSFGLGVKAVGIAGLDQKLNVDTISVITSESSSEKLDEVLTQGIGTGVDIGLLFSPMETMEPTLGISVTDIGGTTFKEVGKTGSAPRTRLPSVNTGVSFKPVKTERNYILVALDAHSINQPSHYSQKFNMGLEWGFSKIIKIETGLMSGYPTGGFQFDVGLLKLRLATYVVDDGPVVGLHKRLADRRVILQLKILL